MFCGASLLFSLLSLGATASGDAAATPAANGLNLRGPCDDSFPLAAPTKSHGHNRRRRRLVLIPEDKTHRSYAPLCPDGRHIDTRRTQECPGGFCWAENYQSCMHFTSSECTTAQLEKPPTTEPMPNMQERHDGSHTQESHDGSQCTGGQCWAEMYQMCMHITSQECKNPQPSKNPTERPTPSPTVKPTHGMETTVHPVELSLKNVPPDYELTEDVRALIIRFASEILEEYLEEPMELIIVEFGGYLAQRLLAPKKHQNRRRLDDLSVPLRVTIKGPANMSDFALSYVMDILQARLQELVTKLKSYDTETFKDVGVSSTTYNFNEMIEETKNPTRRPTRMPTSRRPTRRPTPFPTKEFVETVHPVALFFKNVPPGYRFSPEDRASIIRFVKKMIEDELDKSLELIEVSYPGILLVEDDEVRRGLNGRRLDTHALPLLVKVRGLADVSDFALVYVMEVFDVLNLRDLCQFLKTLDWTASMNCGVTAKTYDLADIVDGTDAPTRKPTGPMETTVHPVQVIFESAPAGYAFSPEARASLIQFIKELLEDKLDTSLQLIEVAYAGVLIQAGERSLQSRQFAPSLPLLITVRSPADVADFALSYIMLVLRDNQEALEMFMESLDGKVFVNPSPSVESYDPVEISDTSKKETTTHPIQLIFDSAPPGYSLPPENRAPLVQFIKEMMEDKLGDPFELRGVIDAGKLGRLLQSGMRMLQAGAPSLPLLISVNGPSDLSDLARPYILQVIRDNMQDIEDFLESMDPEVFERPEVSAETFDVDDISNDIEVMNDEEDPWWIQPWWVWLLVAVGILLLLCCLCICCKLCCLYRNKGKSQHTKDVFEEKVVQETATERGGPYIIEKPVIVEKPVIYERQLQERPRKAKKHRKKKKRKKTSVVQIEQRTEEQSETFDAPMIGILNMHASDLTARSGITFGFDPPSELYTVEGGDPYNGRLLAPPAEPHLALPSPGGEHMQICAAPSDLSQASARDYSTKDPSQGEFLAIRNGSERGSISYEPASQSQYTRQPIDWDGKASRQSQHEYAKEPSGHEVYENTNQFSVIDPNVQNDLESTATRSCTKEPSGHGWASVRSAVQSSLRSMRTQEPRGNPTPYANLEDRSISIEELPSYQTHHPSFATHPPEQDPRVTAAAVQDSMFASFDDPSFAVEDTSQFASFGSQAGSQSQAPAPKKRSRNRRASGGVESIDGSSAMYFSRAPSSF